MLAAKSRSVPISAQVCVICDTCLHGLAIKFHHSIRVSAFQVVPHLFRFYHLLNYRKQKHKYKNGSIYSTYLLPSHILIIVQGGNASSSYSKLHMLYASVGVLVFYSGICLLANLTWSAVVVFAYESWAKPGKWGKGCLKNSLSWWGQLSGAMLSTFSVHVPWTVCDCFPESWSSPVWLCALERGEQFLCSSHLQWPVAPTHLLNTAS